MARHRLSTVVFALVVGAALARSMPTSGRSDVGLIQRYEVAGLQSDPGPEQPTVDVVIIRSDRAEATWPEMQEDFLEARRIFARYGVHLKLLDAVEVRYPDAWNGLAIEQAERVPRGDLDFYETLDFVANRLPDPAVSVFNALVDQAEHPGRVVYIITVSDLVVSWFEQDDQGQWVSVSSKTSAISFPPYLFADRIPERLRGIISLQRVKPGHKTMAHELGHKLINVSHEGLDHCPRGSGKSVPGLMGYEDSKEIFGGREGRWHVERLQRSPFIYRLRDGKKVWNEDYAAGGVYDDPIYGDLVVEPACANAHDGPGS